MTEKCAVPDNFSIIDRKEIRDSFLSKKIIPTVDRSYKKFVSEELKMFFTWTCFKEAISQLVTPQFGFGQDRRFSGSWSVLDLYTRIGLHIMSTLKAEKKLWRCEMIILIGYTNIEKKDNVYITAMRRGHSKIWHVVSYGKISWVNLQQVHLRFYLEEVQVLYCRK